MAMSVGGMAVAQVRDRQRVRALLREGAELASIAQAFEAMDRAGRIEAALGLGRSDMAVLFERAGAGPVLSVGDLLPSDAQPGESWIWEGVNSLPLFRRFQKRVCRLEAGDETLAGYNHQRLMALTGPGYFVVRAAEPGAPGAVVFDYTRLPARAPAGWPPVVSNERGVARRVYGGLEDFMRAVHPDVLIGRAYRCGEPTSNYFVLVRGLRVE